MSTLKKYAYGLLLTTIGLINFGYCEFSCYPFYTEQFTSAGTVNIASDFEMFCINAAFRSFKYDLNCEGNYNNVLNQQESICFTRSEFENNSICTQANGNNYFIGTVIYFNGDCLDEPYTSLQCQTEYNLIPISSVDQNYCVNNNLCPSQGECPDNPIGTGNWSALYINNIQYNGAPTIRVTIPEEIEREQYTDEEETTIDVIGYGYDQDKMQQMVNTQYYKPTAEEMSGLIEKIADFLPLVAVALLITRLRRVIKKVF